MLWRHQPGALCRLQPRRWPSVHPALGTSRGLHFPEIWGAAGNPLFCSTCRHWLRAGAQGAEAAARGCGTVGTFLHSCSAQEQLKHKTGNLSTGASSRAVVFLCTFLPGLIPNHRSLH